MCAPCCNVQIVETSTWSTFLEAYKNTHVTLGPICTGRPSQLFLLARKAQKKVQTVLVLDARHRRFFEKTSFDTMISGDVSNVSYVTPADCLVVLEKEAGRVSAVSATDGATKWELSKFVDPPFTPRAFAHFFGALLMCDGSATLRVFSARDGSHKHDLTHEKLTNAQDIVCQDDSLIVRQTSDKALKLGVYQLRFEFEKQNAEPQEE